MPHVFISYSRRDTEFVNRLEGDLNARGIPTWRDQHSIPGGEEWFRAIKSGLLDSYAMVYIDTPEAETSKWVTKEYLYAEWLKLRIIPIRLDGRFVSMQTIELNPILCDPAGYEAGVGQLSDLLNGLERKPPTPPQSADTTRSADERDYLDWVLLQWQADLRSALYVSLLATPERAVQRAARLGLPGGRQPALGRLGIERIEAEAFDQPGETVPDARLPLREIRRVVLLGEPGAGKTTTLLQLAVDLAREAQDQAGAKLPVFVPLRAFQGEGAFGEFVRAQMNVLQSQYERLVNEGRLALLCDALNEMPRRSAAGRDLTAEVRDYLRDKADWVVSCRVRDYQEDLRDLTGAGKVRLKPLDPPRIHEVIMRRFHDQPERGTALWTELKGSDGLLEAWEVFEQAGQPEAFWGNNWPKDVKPEGVENYWETPGYSDWWQMRLDPRRGLVLCRNPYMLFLVGEIFDQKGALPRNRGELFATFVDDLLDREEKNCRATGAAWIEATVIRAALATLAYAMQTGEGGTEISRTEAEDRLRDESGVSDPALLLRLAASASLIDTGESVRFTHQLLQEYFASEVMGGVMDANRSAAEFWPPESWWQPQGWEETALILAGVRGDPQGVARWIAPAQPEMAYRALTGSGIEVNLDQIAPETRAALLDSARAKSGEANPIGRAAAYRVLGLFNADDRPGIGLRPDGLPDIEWGAEIPPGTYIIGGDELGYGSLPEQPYTVRYPYRMAKYPVTYAQFQVFLDAPDGFYNLQWWEGLAASDDDKAQPSEQYFQYPNHPRDSVSWYEAVAFCRWLTAQERAHSRAPLQLPEGYEIRLPTEQEWEIAARGTDGRVYPYGNEFEPAKGNTYETGIGRTNAVGIFPDGASPYGVLDMSGNVWEWCLNEYEQPENIGTDGSAARVVRGGSFLDDRGDARAAYRYYFHPGSRIFYIGFRVVCRPPSP